MWVLNAQSADKLNTQSTINGDKSPVQVKCTSIFCPKNLANCPSKRKVFFCSYCVRQKTQQFRDRRFFPGTVVWSPSSSAHLPGWLGPETTCFFSHGSTRPTVWVSKLVKSIEQFNCWKHDEQKPLNCLASCRNTDQGEKVLWVKGQFILSHLTNATAKKSWPEWLPKLRIFDVALEAEGVVALNRSSPKESRKETRSTHEFGLMISIKKNIEKQFNYLSGSFHRHLLLKTSPQCGWLGSASFTPPPPQPLGTTKTTSWKYLGTTNHWNVGHSTSKANLHESTHLKPQDSIWPW